MPGQLNRERVQQQQEEKKASTFVGSACHLHHLGNSQQPVQPPGLLLKKQTRNYIRRGYALAVVCDVNRIAQRNGCVEGGS